MVNPNCQQCQRKFFRSSDPRPHISVIPAARSCFLPDLCNDCARARMAAADPPVTFTEMLRLCMEGLRAS